jgi:4-amino-4-deoxy-L-arabinose transferase-like glycosyltransferase
VSNNCLDYDGALAAMTARHFDTTGRYVLLNFDQESTVMPVGLSTGPTVVLMTVLFFKLFGVSNLTSILTSIVYLIALFVIVYLIGRQYFNKWLVIIFTAIIMLMPGLFQYGLDSLGDVPAAVLLLLSILAWVRLSRKSKNNIAYSITLGVSLSLAFLTKQLPLCRL